MMADAFMQDPRWNDYTKEVRCGDNPSLTWKQYVAALEYKRPQQGSHQERHWSHHLTMSQREPQSQGPRSQVPQWMEAATRAPSKKALKLQEHRRNVALVLGQQRTGAEADVQRRIQRRRQQQDEAENRAWAARWRNNRGAAAALVPLLPPELWAHIFRQGRDEREQLTAWAAWANATLMQLVVVWFRTGGQRNSKWLGKLVG